MLHRQWPFQCEWSSCVIEWSHCWQWLKKVQCVACVSKRKSWEKQGLAREGSSKHLVQTADEVNDSGKTSCELWHNVFFHLLLFHMLTDVAGRGFSKQNIIWSLVRMLMTLRILLKIIISAYLYAHLELKYNLIFLFLKSSSITTKIDLSPLSLMKDFWETLQYYILPGLLGLRVPNRQHHLLSQWNLTYWPKYLIWSQLLQYLRNK